MSENNSKNPIKEGIQAYIDAGFVTYKDDPRIYPQLQVYEECLINNRTDFSWMAFMDADEMIAIRELCAFAVAYFATHSSIGLHFYYGGVCHADPDIL